MKTFLIEGHPEYRIQQSSPNIFRIEKLTIRKFMIFSFKKWEEIDYYFRLEYAKEKIKKLISEDTSVPESTETISL